MKKFVTTVFIFLTLLVANVNFVQAQCDNSVGTGSSNAVGAGGGSGGSLIKLDNPFQRGCGDLFALLEAIVNDIVLPIGGVLVVLAFIYSGFKYVTANGKEDKIKEAHRALLYTAIGTAILLGSWIIANVIGNTVNQLQ